jgi:hypothetical protein
MAQALYWAVFTHLQANFPAFAPSKRAKGFLFRFKREVFILDSTTLQLALNCFDWARHRRKKAAAKLHMRLDLASTLPAFALLESARHHDATRADALCAGLKEGDVLLADRAYTDLKLLYGLHERGVTFVMRQKCGMRFRVRKKQKAVAAWKGVDVVILADEVVMPELKSSRAHYPGTLRRVTADVRVDKQMTRMVFLTNNTEWSARTIAELYKARWAIELFFKELKQTCAIDDFVGYNENAVAWQVWTALLVHLLLRFVQAMAKWKLSFSRLAGVIRATLWLKRHLEGLLNRYGTAPPVKPGGIPRIIQLLLPLRC